MFRSKNVSPQEMWEKRHSGAKAHVASLNDDQKWALWQALAGDGHRFYGDGGTIHQTGSLDVCVDASGVVREVWFRCQNLPFVQREARIDVTIHNPDINLSGVVVSDRNF